jgi:hypothetical protein
LVKKVAKTRYLKNPEIEVRMIIEEMRIVEEKMLFC